MKILYITDEHLNASSAETVHIEAICSNFVALGNEVTLFAPNSDFHASAQYVLEYVAAPKALNSLFFQFKLFFLLRKKFKTNKPDLIYARHNQLLFVPALLSRAFSAPLILESNGRLVEETKQRNSSTLDKMLVVSGALSTLESYNVRVAKKIIVVAAGIKEYLLKNYKVSSDKIAVLPNGVDTAAFSPMSARDARARLGFDPNKLYVGYLGSFYEWQGIRYMLDAFKYVAATVQQAEFVIVGKGDQEEYIKDFIAREKLEHMVRLVPAVPHEQAPLYINALDVCLCYPIKFRAGATAPFKIYEYLACGKATVVSDIGGIRDEFGDTLAYAEAENAQDLSEKITQVIKNPELRERLGSQGRKMVEQGRSWRAVTEKIEALCKEVLSNN